jgi:hypothetical protein
MYQNGGKFVPNYTELPIDHKVYQIAVIFYKIYQHFPFQGLPKTRIWIFGLKIFYLATLVKRFETAVTVSICIGGSVARNVSEMRPG